MVSWSQDKPASEQVKLPELTVKACDDFQLTGSGQATAWNKSDWVALNKRPNSKHDYETRFKMLYSKTGVYVLFDGADAQLTSTKREDFLDLWTEDVYECFFWTDERHPVYFEYEISPLGYELPILIPNIDGRFLGWRPWSIGEPGAERKTRKATAARGGDLKSLAKVSGWSAEVFIPYDMLKPLANVPPKPGTIWRANFYRMDYDGQQQGSWDWARVGPSFHEYKSFGRLVFE
ncbi:MAG: carbohydrate-binding family 9-like protein [Pirellulaceae bacterium]|nr:carbohydrate-binding family 9-like protein [Pirellulaceae bacterium]